MHKQTRYAITKPMMQAFDFLNLPVARVLKRAGLPGDHFGPDGGFLTGAQLFAMWDALEKEVPEPDLPLRMARMLARGPFLPALFAFSCSPDILTGFLRLAVFKPLVAPMKLVIDRTDAGVSVEVALTEPGLELPNAMAVFDMVFFVEICRIHTGVDIRPKEVGLPCPVGDEEVYAQYFDRAAVPSERPRLVLSHEDAQRPLITENPEMWAGFEKDLTRQLAAQRRNTAVSVRVRNALLELLPSGQASVDAVCARLLMSRRSLQRYLKAEGESFQRVLDATRADLSLHYLRRGDMSVEEISYLLAYRDPNSFYRAFQSWTGQTPAQARGALA